MKENGLIIKNNQKELFKTMKAGGFFGIKKRFQELSKNVKWISLSIFLFMLGWGLGTDTFYSIFIESIVDNVFWVSLIVAILPITKIFFTPAVGVLDDEIERKYSFYFGKISYTISGILYFLAGVFVSKWILLFAIFFTGLGCATCFVIYFTILRSNCDKNHSESAWGLFFSSYNGAYVIGALTSALLVHFLDLPYFYISISAFSLLSLWADKFIVFEKIKTGKKNNISLKNFLGKLFSFKPMGKIFKYVKAAPKLFKNGLGYELLYSLLDYVSFLFIPLVALQNNLGLAQIALIFAMMRLPYLFNFIVSGMNEGRNKKLYIAIILVFLAGLFSLLAFKMSFSIILIVSFCIAFGLSAMRPVVSALITEQTPNGTEGQASGAQNLSAYLGHAIGTVGFGILSSLFSVETAFLFVGISLFVLAILSFGKRGNERIKKVKNKMC